MRGKTKIFVIILALSFAVIFISYDWLSLKKLFLVTFRQSGTVGRINSSGKIEGEIDVYVHGKLAQRANALNGELDGWRIEYYLNQNVKTKSLYKKGKLDGLEFTYYDDGKIKSKESFAAGKREGPKTTYYQNGQIEESLIRKNDKVQGVQNAYYNDGKLKFKGNWFNDKLFGDQYLYYESGKVKIYHSYDILGEKVYLSHYDESGKLVQNDGYVFSNNIYSKQIGSDSSIVLQNNRSYNSIQDLYINFANPPHVYTPAIKVAINNKLYKNVTILNKNTAKIIGAFPKKGIYHIVLDGAFLDKSNKIIGERDLIGEFTITRSQ